MNLFTILDNIISSFSHLRLNYRQTAIASIGLIISLSIVASTAIFLQTQSSSVLENVIGKDNTNMVIKYNILQADQPFDANKFNSIINSSLTYYNLMNKVSSAHSYFVSHDFFRIYNKVISSHKITLPVLDDLLLAMQTTDLSLLQPYINGYTFSTYNQTNNLIPAILMYFTNTTTNLRVGIPQIGQIVPTGFVIATTVNNTYVKNITIIGNLPISTNLYNKLIASGFYFPEDTSHDYLLVPNLSNFMIYMNDTFSNDPLVTRAENTGYYYSSMYSFNPSAFDGFNPFGLIQQFNTLDFNLRSNCYSSGFVTFSITDNFNTYLKLKEIEIYSLFATIIAFTIPIIIISLFIADFTLNLFQRQSLVQIRLLLVRGVGKTQLMMNYLFDMFLALIIAIFGSFIISVPLSNLTAKTSDILEFNANKMVNWSFFALLQTLVLFGILLLIIFNFSKIFKFLRLNVADIDSEIVKEKKDPFWKRKYIDILLLGIGFFFNSLPLFNIFNFSSTSSQILSFQYLNSNISSLQVSYQILSLIFLLTPVYVFIGSIMFLSRIYPIITSILSNLAWNHGMDMFSYSLKNMLRHKSNSIRAIILTAITISFIIAFFVFPLSYEANIRDSTYYSVGADIYVPVLSMVKSNYIEYLQTYNDAIGFLNNLSTQIQAYTPIIIAALKGNPIMAINTTTFAHAAWMRQDFAPDLGNELQKLNVNNSILLYSNNLKALNLNVGDTVLWPNYQNSSQTLNNILNVNYYFTIQGTFNYWPKLILSSTTGSNQRFYGVMSLSTYKNINEIANTAFNTSFFQQINALQNFQYDLPGSALGLYIHTYPNTNLTYLTTMLQKHFNSQINVQVYNYNNALASDPFFNIILSQINNNIIYCLMIVFLLIFIYGFYQISERGKEVAIERSFGMTLRQNIKILLYELGWTIIFSIITGVIIGAIFSSLLILPTQGFSHIPPVIIVYPIPLLINIFILVLSLTLLCSLIPAYISTKLEIKDLLKVE